MKNFFQDVNKFGYLNIYKSFGCINKFYNKYDSSIVLEASNKLEEIYPKISSKDDILKIEIENIYIGDLLYDTFLITKKGSQVLSVSEGQRAGAKWCPAWPSGASVGG